MSFLLYLRAKRGREHHYLQGEATLAAVSASPEAALGVCRPQVTLPCSYFSWWREAGR